MTQIEKLIREEMEEAVRVHSLPFHSAGFSVRKLGTTGIIYACGQMEVGGSTIAESAAILAARLALDPALVAKKKREAAAALIKEAEELEAV